MPERVIQNGIIAGNYSNKYESKNPIAKFLIDGFLRTLGMLVDTTGVTRVHEIGCGEGYVSRFLVRRGLDVRASDFSDQIVEIARKATAKENMQIDFKVTSIYNMHPETDSAPLVICCEVLEHLEHPDRAIPILKALAKPYLILSVPREPLWRFMNILRGQYLSDFGNTPGHIQHWSKKSFLKWLQKQQLKILKVVSPVPWTFVLCESASG